MIYCNLSSVFRRIRFRQLFTSTAASKQNYPLKKTDILQLHCATCSQLQSISSTLRQNTFVVLCKNVQAGDEGVLTRQTSLINPIELLQLFQLLVIFAFYSLQAGGSEWRSSGSGYVPLRKTQVRPSDNNPNPVLIAHVDWHMEI